MIPEKPQIITTPICYNGDKRAIPESTPLGSNQLSFESGFPVLTSTPLNAGGLPPDRLDFNAALNLLSTFIYYMQSGNQFAWNNQLDYNTGAFVLGSDNAVYFCIQANGATSPNTVQNPVSASSYWLKIINSNGKINADNLSVTLGALATKSTITSADITDGTITTNDIANNAITSAKIADGTIVNADIANTTITGAKLVNKTITSTQIADNTITAAQLAANSVGAPELADNAVDTNAIANLAVTNAKIANAAVNDAKISGVSASKVSGLATVAKTGSYNDLLNKPTIPTNAAPLPTSSSSTVGQIYYQNSYGPVTVPTGGSWLCLVFGYNGAGDFFNVSNYQISPGGTVFSLGSGEGGKGLCAWRIQ